MGKKLNILQIKKDDYILSVVYNIYRIYPKYKVDNVLKMSGVRNRVGYLVLLLVVFLSVSKSTTIRVRKSTKDKIMNLDFVKKNTYDEILLELVEFYEKRKKIN